MWDQLSLHTLHVGEEGRSHKTPWGLQRLLRKAQACRQYHRALMLCRQTVAIYVVLV
jgi:hypothetical protein